MRFEVGQVWQCRDDEFKATIIKVVGGDGDVWRYQASIRNGKDEIEEEGAYFDSMGKYFDDDVPSGYDLDVLVSPMSKTDDLEFGEVAKYFHTAAREDRIYDLAREMFLKLAVEQRSVQTVDLCIADATVFVLTFERRRDQAKMPEFKVEHSATILGEQDAD